MINPKINLIKLYINGNKNRDHVCVLPYFLEIDHKKMQYK